MIRAADTLAEATSRLKSSPKFCEWGKLRPEEAHIDVEERHYTPQDLAEAWGVSTETVRQIFREEPGVLKIGKPGTRSKRGYFTLRIPQEVAERVHRRLSA
jgi:hypothetical protein